MKNKRQNNSRRSDRLGGRGIRPGEMSYSGSVQIPISATTTPSAFTLNSLLSAGTAQFLKNVGDSFQLYRFEDLKLTFYPFANAASNNFVSVGFQQELEDNVPANVAQMSDMPWNQSMTNSQTVPVSFRVPPRVLKAQGLEQFWRTQLPSQTNTGTGTLPSSNLWESVQGAFWFAASAAITCFTVLKYVVKLASPLAPTLTPKPKVRTEALLGWPHQSLLGEIIFPEKPRPGILSRPTGGPIDDGEDQAHKSSVSSIALRKASSNLPLWTCACGSENCRPIENT